MPWCRCRALVPLRRCWRSIAPLCRCRAPGSRRALVPWWAPPPPSFGCRALVALPRPSFAPRPGVVPLPRCWRPPPRPSFAPCLLVPLPVRWRPPPARGSRRVCCRVRASAAAPSCRWWPPRARASRRPGGLHRARASRPCVLHRPEARLLPWWPPPRPRFGCHARVGSTAPLVPLPLLLLALPRPSFGCRARVSSTAPKLRAVVAATTLAPAMGPRLTPPWWRPLPRRWPLLSARASAVVPWCLHRARGSRRALVAAAPLMPAAGPRLGCRAAGAFHRAPRFAPRPGGQHHTRGLRRAVVPLPLR